MVNVRNNNLPSERLVVINGIILHVGSNYESITKVDTIHKKIEKIEDGKRIIDWVNIPTARLIDAANSNIRINDSIEAFVYEIHGIHLDLVKYTQMFVEQLMKILPDEEEVITFISGGSNSDFIEVFKFATKHLSSLQIGNALDQALDQSMSRQED